MKCFWPILCLALAACGAQSPSNATSNATAQTAQSEGACALPQLDFLVVDLNKAEEAELNDNFKRAYSRACGEKLFNEKPLVDPQSDNTSRLVVFNAPEANVVSIFFSRQSHGASTILEAPFGSPPHKIPSADDLHEAI
jgi:hypothetical protein